MKPEMIPFYLSGRSVTRLSKIRALVADPEEIAEVVESGRLDFRAAITDACDEAAKQYAANRKRREKWFEESKLELEESKVDKTAAWEAYCKGVGDELAYVLEPDVLNELYGEDEAEDDGDEEEGEGSDDDDDDDEVKT